MNQPFIQCHRTNEEYADQRSKIKKAFFQIHMRMSFISITENQIDFFTPQTDLWTLK
ncbi:unnamed protein product [Brassica oleracea]